MSEDEPEEEVLAEAPPEEMGAEDVTVLLLTVPERVSDLLFGLTAEQLAYRHGPAFPTAGEIAHHLAESGAALDAAITSAALETAPAELTRQATGQPLPDAIADAIGDWQRQRRRAVDLLRGLAPEGWERPVEDEPLIAYCRRALAHEFGHLSQLRNLTALVPLG